MAVKCPSCGSDDLERGSDLPGNRWEVTCSECGKTWIRPESAQEPPPAPVVGPVNSAVEQFSAEELISYWEKIISHFIQTGSALPPGDPYLTRWFRTYKGVGRGEVQLDVFPEPYLGPVKAGSTCVAILALNPGGAVRDLQAQDGGFIEEIRRLGSYRAWAESWPYLTGLWIERFGYNKHHSKRITFLNRWFEEDFDRNRFATFEMYPWHSFAVEGGDMRPDAGIIRRFILGPIDDLGIPLVVSFGAPWVRALETLKLPVLGRLGEGGVDYGSEVRSRSILISRTPGGALWIAEKHRGSASPPRIEEVSRLREHVRALGFDPTPNCVSLQTQQVMQAQ